MRYLGLVVATREDAGWKLVGGIGTIGRGSGPRGGGLAHGDKHISVMVVTAADWAPAPVPWMGTKAKEDSLGTLIWVGPHYWEGWRSLISLLRGRPGSCPRSAVTAALREAEGWRGGASLISKASPIGW